MIKKIKIWTRPTNVSEPYLIVNYLGDFKIIYQFPGHSPDRKAKFLGWMLEINIFQNIIPSDLI